MRSRHRQRAKILRPLTPLLMLNSQHAKSNNNFTDALQMGGQPVPSITSAGIAVIQNLPISNWTRFNESKTFQCFTWQVRLAVR